MKQLTVFTPTYNRAYILPSLYESLTRQTCDDFVWIIVDDGSTDNTRELVDGWIAAGKIDIAYHYQSNQGKSMAHNKGAEMAETQLFICVDSDDHLHDDAVNRILTTWNANKSAELTGIVAFKADFDKTPTTHMEARCVAATLYDLYGKWGMSGDAMLALRRDLVARHPFPHFAGEKFVPEAYLYDRIDTHGKLFVLPEYLYYAEYLPDGYTSNMARLLKHNPEGYLAFIRQRLSLDRTMKSKFLDSIRYVAMSLSARHKKIITAAVYPAFAFLAYPAGYLFYRLRYARVD